MFLKWLSSLGFEVVSCVGELQTSASILRTIILNSAVIVHPLARASCPDVIVYDDHS